VVNDGFPVDHNPDNDELRFPTLPTTPGPEPGGCATTGERGSSGSLLAAIVALLFLRRRR
jgi:MYXO-CTERM domain-containing protein